MAISCPSCENCLVIDLCCVYDYTPLNEAVGEAAVKVALILAQETILASYSYIGQTCYESLCTAISEDDLSDEQTAIISEVKKALAWSAYQNWLELYGSGENRREGRKSDQGSDQLRQMDYEQLGKDISKAEGIAASYWSKFRKYLECNELSCDTCEEVCNTCGSTCGHDGGCTCEASSCLDTKITGKYIPYRRDTLRDVGSGQPMDFEDDWAAV